MKKFLSIVLLAFAMQASAQTNPITSINISLPANPDANTANWGTGTSQLTITAASQLINGKVNGLVVESKILVIIKKNGAKICGSYTSGNAPAAGFNTATKVWSGSNAASLIGEGCTLQPGEYELSVQFFGYRGAVVMPISDERTKPFSIRGSEQQSYREPQNIVPGNGTTFNEGDIKKPITFRWTPVVPRPQEPTTYRLRVWQLMEGQNTTQARTVNQPIFTKDVDNLTQAIATNLITGPCKPPYLCSFIWNVQALNREGKPIGSNNGTSELFSFKYDTGGGVTDDAKTSISLTSPADGANIQAGTLPLFKWEAVTNQTSAYKIKIVEVRGDQSPEQAIRTNKPHFEKDSLDDLSFHYPTSGELLLPGKKYAWNVQALNRQNKPVATSGVNYFIIITDPSAGCFKIDTSQYKIICKGFDKEGKPVYSVINLLLTNIGTNPGRTGLHNTAAGNYITPTGFTVANLSPASAVNILPNNSTSISFDIVGATGTSVTFVVNSTIPDPGGNTALFCDKSIGVKLDLPPCVCNFCDEIKEWKFEGDKLTATTEGAATINLNTTITAPNLAITAFKAELVSFTQDGKQQACFGCNTDSQTYGNFTGGTFGAWGNGIFPLYGSSTTHHTLSWFSATGATTNLAGSAINLTFTAPPLNPLNCCDDEITFCIRYSFTDKECRTCSFVKCYTITRKHK